MRTSSLQIRTTGGTCPSSPTTPVHISLPLHLRPSPPAAPGPAEPSLPLRAWGWPRGARLGFPRGREGILEKLLPMASGPRGFGTRGGQERLGRSRGTVCECVRARARAAGGGPCRGCGRGRAGRRSPPSLGAAPSSARPARRGGPRASRLPACHSPRRGRGPRAGPWAGAGGARGSPIPRAGARVPAGDGRRGGSGALPPGHRVRAPGASAGRLGGGLGPRPRGRPLRRRAWRPPAGGSAWSGALWSAGRAGRPRRLPPAAAAPAPRPPQSPGFPRSGCYGDSCAGE